MKEYIVPEEVLIKSEIDSVGQYPLVRTIARFIAIKDFLKKQGMKFRPTPDSLFHTELPINETASYFCVRRRCHVYVEKPTKLTN